MTATRRYIYSSSFKMAALFTVMLGISAGILGYVLYGVAPEAMPEDTLSLIKLLGIAMVILMLGVVLVSFVISHFVVSRINRIAKTAQHIVATGDLSQRISIDTHWDDLSNLAQVLNQFLEQIEYLMSGVREVSNNIAHDLRTPLTRLRSDIESLKGNTVRDDDLDGLLHEADRILSIFQSLLRITNIERGKRHLAKKTIQMSSLLRDVIELYEPVAEQKHITLSCDIESKLTIQGDRDLLFQLFANLIDNAIKFSPSNSEVTVTIQGQTIIVKDHGPGLSDAQKKQAFDHFFRGDASRGSEGYGLGLSLVKAIIDKHQGTIILKDGNPGLEVWIAL